MIWMQLWAIISPHLMSIGLFIAAILGIHLYNARGKKVQSLEFKNKQLEQNFEMQRAYDEKAAQENEVFKNEDDRRDVFFTNVNFHDLTEPDKQLYNADPKRFIDTYIDSGKYSKSRPKTKD